MSLAATPVRRAPEMALTLNRAGILLVLAAYITGGMLPYKTWYIATVLAVSITGVFVIVGWMRIGRLFTAVIPLSVYVAYLYIAGSYSEFPADAHFYAAADLIQIPIFGLFYLLIINDAPDALSRIMLQMSFVGTAMTVVQFALASQSVYGTLAQNINRGTLALTTMPFCAAFSVAAMANKQQRKLAFVTFVLAWLVLLIGQARTPILVSFIDCALVLAIAPINLRLKVRMVATVTAAVAIAIAAAWFYPTTNDMVRRTAARFLQQDIVIDGNLIPAEHGDPVRDQIWATSLRLLPEAQPFGIGYWNFPRLFERETDIYTSIHSVYMVWAVEGGFCCVLIVLWMLALHIRWLRRAMRRAIDARHRELARTLVIITIGDAVWGLFDQLQQGPLFFMVLGCGAGVGAVAMQQVRRKRIAVGPQKA